MSSRLKRDQLRSWNKHNGAACWLRQGLPGTPSGKHISKDCDCGACSTGVKTTGKAKIGGKAA